MNFHCRNTPKSITTRPRLTKAKTASKVQELESWPAPPATEIQLPRLQLFLIIHVSEREGYRTPM